MTTIIVSTIIIIILIIIIITTTTAAINFLFIATIKFVITILNTMATVQGLDQNCKGALANLREGWGV